MCRRAFCGHHSVFRDLPIIISIIKHVVQSDKADTFSNKKKFVENLQLGWVLKSTPTYHVTITYHVLSLTGLKVLVNTALVTKIAAIFFVASVTKLRDSQGTYRARLKIQPVDNPLSLSQKSS